MPASIGLGDVGHPADWPRPGPGGPRGGATQVNGGQTLDRTFYGPHLEPQKYLPVLALAELGTPGMAPAWTWGQAYFRPRTPMAGPWTGWYSCRPVETGGDSPPIKKRTF